MRQKRLQLFRIVEQFAPAIVLPLEVAHEVRHLVFVPGGVRAGQAAPDVRALRGARAEGDVDVEVVRVVVNTVGKTDRVVRMETLREFPHDFFHRGLEHAVGVDPGGDELVVKRLRHREDEPVLEDGIFRRRGELADVLKPRFGQPPLALVVATVRRACRPNSRGLVVEKSAGVNLAEGFPSRRSRRTA